MSGEKFCVFCGSPPVNKNREHVLPQWLLSLTGDPSRVVNLGFDYKRNKIVRFAWNALVMPACESCNTEFATLESEVSPLVESLLGRGSLTSIQYSKLLDWLDKVRVGLWLNYHILQGNPTDIAPSFYVKSRMRSKDRFLAVYPVDEKSKGLNAFGVESLAFHREPAVFGLRINDVLIVNCSSDYLCSSRCGFPYPSKTELKLDGENSGKAVLSEFKASRKIKSPISRFSLYKPSVYVFQPIVQVPVKELIESGFKDSVPELMKYLEDNTLEREGLKIGKLYRQFGDGVRRMDDENEPLDFDSIVGNERQPMARLVSQIYELQSHLTTLYTPVAENPQVRQDWELLGKEIRKESRAKIRRLINGLANS